MDERITKGKMHNNISEPDTIDIYKEKTRKTEPINTHTSVFTSPMSKGINTDESVFDKMAVFQKKYYYK